jgi:hypothetical protein
MSRDTTSGASGWHVDADALRSWVDGDAGPLVSVSVEQHVQRCAHCQRTVTRFLPDTLRSPWDDVLAAVEVSPAGRVERLLLRLGLGRSDSRVVACAPTLRAPWIAGMIGVLAFVTLAAILADNGGLALFLLVAPLVPVAGVAAAYGPSSDPSYEAVLASPYAMLRLVLLRAAAVLVTSVPLVVGSGLVLPASPAVAVAWLLPAAGFIAVVLTASCWVDPTHAATAVALAWTVAVTLAQRAGDPMAVFGPTALAVYVGVLAVAVLTLMQRLLSATPSWRLR